jgi:hypothetical protein
MALWVCGGEAGCGTKYAVGLFRCPRCHNTEFFEDGDPMAKITRHGGASDKTLPTTEDAAAAETDPAPEAAADQPEARVAEGEYVLSQEALREHARNLVEPDFTESLARREAEGGEGSSPGSSSSASTEPQPTSSEPSVKSRRKPARTTGSRSSKGLTESGSVPSTDGPKTDESSTADGAE